MSLQVFFLRMLPKKAISRWVGRFAKSRASRDIIPAFARRFGIDLAEAELPLESYGSLHEFFIRRLKPGLRPVDPAPDRLVSPVDGRVSAFGPIEEGTLIQAKGIRYTVEALLADKERASRYAGGSFVTIYLSPKDYHRIHTPIAGQVTGWTYVPGELFPVNAVGVQGIPGLFAKNERLISHFTSSFGPWELVKVGATIVGGIQVVYADAATNLPDAQVSRETLPHPFPMEKGDEVGYFEFGSTVILLFPPGAVSFRADLQEGMALRMGEYLGDILVG